ncbi:matrixin family metalloprotease [Actinoplanes sp. NPDC051513]|uniref:matrixin family metalloprotease n=1 Tax=Actinoplanes sp. NPDC051513 TaxID=3363908 RepID=UPI0037A710D4
MITTNELVDKIKASAPTVQLELKHFGISATRFVVEGDIGIAEAAVPAYAARRIEIASAAQADPDADRQGLLGIERDGRTLRWRPGTKLTYAVWRPTFPTDAEHEKVVDGMAAATAAWQSICGFEFEYVPAKDTDENLQFGDVSFPVVRQDGGGNTIAMAFFPDDPVNQRLVWVFDGYFSGNGGFDPVGVLRHELGHVLGFRHEHIRPEAPDLFNPESLEHTVEITAYDPTSVMHYVAPGIGDPQLRFTEADRTGARVVYGGPYSEFSFAD